MARVRTVSERLTREKPSMHLEGSDVVKGAEFGDTVNLTVKAKVVGMSENKSFETNKKVTSQRLEIQSMKLAKGK